MAVPCSYNKVKFFEKPFHAAEQHSKVRLNDSAEYPLRGATFRVVRSLRAAQGIPLKVG